MYLAFVHFTCCLVFSLTVCYSALNCVAVWLQYPPDPMNHAKTFALWELFNWYKSFLPDHFGQAEMNDLNMLSNKTSTA